MSVCCVSNTILYKLCLLNLIYTAFCCHFEMGTQLIKLICKKINGWMHSSWKTDYCMQMNV